MRSSRLANPQIHGSQNGPSRLVRRHMVRPGNVIVVGGNAGLIGQLGAIAHFQTDRTYGECE